MSLWWGLFVLSVLFNRYDGTRYEDAESLMEIRDAAVQYTTADAVHMAAPTAAAYFAVRLTTMQRTKAVEGPYRPVVVKDASA